jgi:hypothetical protein
LLARDVLTYILDWETNEKVNTEKQRARVYDSTIVELIKSILFDGHNDHRIERPATVGKVAKAMVNENGDKAPWFVATGRNMRKVGRENLRGKLLSPTNPPLPVFPTMNFWESIRDA